MVHNYIVKSRQKHPLHFTLLDPGKMGPDNLVELSTQTAEAGTDGFMIGGSTDLSLEKVDAAVDAIKKILIVCVIPYRMHARAVSISTLQKEA